MTRLTEKTAVQKNRELVQSRNELTKINQELQQRVARQTEELKKKQAELDTQNEKLREASQACKLSRGRYADLYDFAPLGYATLDGHGVIREINLTGASLLGVDRSSLIGMPFTPFISKTDGPAFYDHLRRCKKASRKISTEMGIIVKDGKALHVQLYSIPVHDIEGQEPLYRTAIIDITKRKEAEKTILKAKEEWELTFDAIIDPVMILDTEYRIVKANKAMATQLGVTPSEAKELICHKADHGTVETPSFCHYAQLLADGQPHSLEIHEPGIGGHFHLIASPIYDSDGKLQGSIVYARDINERKDLENQLRHAQKMEAIGTLAGGVAHDFNNILTAIIGFGNLVQMNLPEDDPLNSHIGQILVAADRATKLTRSLITFSRKQELELKPTNLNEVILDAEKMLGRLIREDIELRTTLAGKALMVMVDRAQIEQVLMNLAVNARDAICERGAVVISSELVLLDHEFKKVHGYGEPGSYALLTFSDTGTGMDEQTRQRIFEPFFTTKEVGKGTGLGLAMVYGTIKQHNGFINCYSEPGIGTTFRIYLPIVSAEAEISQSAFDIPLPGGTETILLAEDDEQVRCLSKNLLENFGYKVIEAADGEEAVSQFAAHKDKIHLALLDVIMPRMNGRQVYRQIEQINPGTKVIFTSGYTADVFQKEEKFEETLNFVPKPITPKELLMTIRKLLDS